MPDYIRDPELDQLVKQLNQTSGEPAETENEPKPAPERIGRSDVREGEALESVLAEMLRRGASDLLLITSLPPVLRVNGQLARIDMDALDEEEIRAMLMPHLGTRLARQLEAEGSADFSIRLKGSGTNGSRSRDWRFRINAHRQRGQLAAAIRALPADIPTLQQLNLPPSLAELVRTTRGLFLVCGPTGSGKSSTLAALIGEINRTSSRHVITIEDPVEYEHRNTGSVIEQIEVGRDAPSFPAALRAALRQDPDVILVGEMRDLETVATAITAAETGHLILSTLHTSDSSQAIHRMIDVFPAAQQTQIRQQLALCLHAIVTQQLIPRADIAGRIPAVELMIANQPIRQHIRSDKLQNLASELTLGKRQGMITLEESLAALVKSGRIAPEEAQIRMRHPEYLQSYMGGE